MNTPHQLARQAARIQDNIRHSHTIDIRQQVLELSSLVAEIALVMEKNEKDLLDLKQQLDIYRNGGVVTARLEPGAVTISSGNVRLEFGATKP